MNRENQKRIQLLADGELSHDDRRQFLAAIEQDSELWREIAVAFVEKQVLDGALGAAPARLEPKRSLPARNSDSNWRALPWWIGIAASLVLGLLAGALWNSNSTAPAIAEHSTSIERNNERTAPNDPSSESLPKLRLDEALARSVKPISMEARRELLKAGYLVDEVPQIADVQLPSGQAIKMPVRRFNIQYLGNAAYQ